MTLFVDASALVAIMTNEDGCAELSRQITEDGVPLWSAVSRWESVRALSRLLEMATEEAEAIVDEFTSGLFKLVAIGEVEARIAIAAHRRYGKGNHLARLNIGDCFAYACAKANNARLLCKGDDFARTDLA